MQKNKPRHAKEQKTGRVSKTVMAVNTPLNSLARFKYNWYCATVQKVTTFNSDVEMIVRLTADSIVRNKLRHQ